VLQHLSPSDVAKQVTQDVYDRTLELSRTLGVRIAKPRAPRIATEVATVVQYAQRGIAKLSNSDVPKKINSVIETLTSCCYPPATAAARAIFDRKAGEAQSDIELALLAARARWDIELGLDVPIRWLAALAGISVKTARNVASTGQLSTQTKRGGQVATAKEAARWLGTRGIQVAVDSRRVAHR
jgi:hypothetical protein